MLDNAVMKSLMQTGRSTLEDGREVCPMAVAIKEGGEQEIALLIGDAPVPELLGQFGKMLREGGIRATQVYLLSDTWIAHEMPPEGKRVRDMPERKDCLMVAGHARDGEKHIISAIYERKGSRIKWEEESTSGTIVTGMTDLFWQEQGGD